MQKIITAIASLFYCCTVCSQDSTAVIDSTFFKSMNEVVVTATRTERKLGNVAIPTQIVAQKIIRLSGSLRLNDILQEQTGIFITGASGSGSVGGGVFGNGVQLQGLSPDHTMILLDGEPLIGRQGGVMDLSRFAIGNIKKIEIVKGPSSSLYGSEAMAGVINILTDRSYKKQLGAGVRYGFGNPDKGWVAPAGSNTFKNFDFNINGSRTFKRLGAQFFSNAYYIDGFSLRPFSDSRVAQPIWRFTNQAQLSYSFSNKTKFNLSVRHAYDYIRQEFVVSNNGAITNSYGREANSDLNIAPVLAHQFSKKIKTSLRLYGTFFNGSQHLKFKEKPDSSYKDEFQQNFYRAENQTDFNFKTQ